MLGNTDVEISGTKTSVLNKTDVFWVVAPCSIVEVTDATEVLAASIIRVMTMQAPSIYEIYFNV